jgi:flagellar hook-associated protein 1
MSLSAALGTARSSLFNTSRQTSVVSQNIANAHNSNYARRDAELVSMGPGARIAAISRATNEALFRQNLSALSSWNGQASLLAGMEQLGTSVNGVDYGSSPSTMLGKLQTALQAFSSTPSSGALAENVVENARQFALTLNRATASVQDFRVQTDAQIATAVSELNGLLARFGDVNTAIVIGTRGGRDVTEELDQRDAILKQMAEYVPVSATVRGDNEMVVTTADGTMLFETIARSVTFEQSFALAPGISGGVVSIDGVAVAGGVSGNAGSGKLAALVQLRDNVAPTMQAQLDEIARGVIATFAESDQTGSGLPDLAGLFTWPGGPALPADGAVVTGLAGSITINAAYDATAGGNPARLRDGGVNGAAYNANPAGNASYSEWLNALLDRFDTARAFDATAGAGETTSLSTYATNSISWFEAQRQDASRAEENRNALVARSGAALSNATGVNIDEEMAMLLALEHSYQASARIITAVDQMLATLLAAVR